MKLSYQNRKGKRKNKKKSLISMTNRYSAEFSAMPKTERSSLSSESLWLLEPVSFFQSSVSSLPSWSLSFLTLKSTPSMPDKLQTSTLSYSWSWELPYGSEPQPSSPSLASSDKESPRKSDYNAMPKSSECPSPGSTNPETAQEPYQPDWPLTVKQ